MILTKGSISIVSAQLGDFREGTLLALEASEQEFPGITAATDAGRLISTRENTPESTSDLREFIAFEFSLVPEVEYVFTAFRENQIFYVWIVTNEFEASVRERIYDRQQAVIDEFKEFEFDFYIIARLRRNIEDLIGDDSLQLTYAREEVSAD